MNPPDRLDELLRRWAAGAEADRDRLDALRGRILARVTSQQETGRAEPGATVLVPAYRRYAYAAALAAALLACVLWWRSGQGWSPRTAVGPSLSSAIVSDQELRVGRQVFDEMERLFYPRLKWVSESNGEIGIGVGSETDRPAGTGSPVLVRLALMSRAAGGSAWQRAWTMQVVLRSEEVAQAIAVPGLGQGVTLWAYPLGDGEVAVDASVSAWPRGGVLAANALVRDGIPAEVLRVRSDGTEYRLVETVRVIPAPLAGGAHADQRG